MRSEAVQQGSEVQLGWFRSSKSTLKSSISFTVVDSDITVSCLHPGQGRDEQSEVKNDRKSGFSDFADYSPREDHRGETHPVFCSSHRSFPLISIFLSVRHLFLCVLSAPSKPTCPKMKSSPLHSNLLLTCVLSLQDWTISPINQAWDLMVSVLHFNKDFT